MIIVQIRSGLGNQMFQYAFARNLALRNKTTLKLDLGFYRSYALRRYELDDLSIAAKELSWAERGMLRVARSQRFPALRALAEYMHGGGSIIALTDRQEGFDDAAYAQHGNIYLQGFWQSWRYFSEIRPLLLREFDVSLPCDSRNTEMMGRIRESNSVCIHVRRGDYVKNPETATVFGACPVEYYRAAAAQLRERVVNPEFFVFSDDLEWAKEHLGDHGNFVYVGLNHGQPPACDLRLMRACRHFIISNSTFGWWAAWLSEGPGKVVLSPQSWYKTNWTTRDLLPPDWITLPNALT